MLGRCIAIVILVAQLGFGQDAAQVVERVVRNELAAAKNDHSSWMYRDSNTDKGKSRVEEVVQTREGWIRRLIAENGKPPSADDEKKNQDEIHKLLTDANYRRQQREKLDKDGQKATDLLAMLPKAFLYTLVGQQNGIIQLSFQPNPSFHPPTREAKVFHGMAGTLLVDAKAMRLVKLSGHLIQTVDFGGGILGKLDKGGTFEVDQADVGGGHWEMTKLDVHISGHALFFATIKEQQHEVISDFHQIPETTTLAQAAEMVKTAPVERASR